MSAGWEVQKALYSAISGLGMTVYDAPQQPADAGNDAGWPFVTIGEIVLAPFDTKTRTGFDVSARVHVRSRSGGTREARDMLGLIYGRLHQGALTVTGYSTVLLQFSGTEDVTQVADKSFHGVAEYRGVIEAA